MGGVVLAGCGSSSAAGSPSSQVCGRVSKAAHLQAQADATSGAAARKFEVEATRQLDLAEPLASLQAGGSENWQSLMMTLLQTHQVPTSHLIPAATAACDNITHTS